MQDAMIGVMDRLAKALKPYLARPSVNASPSARRQEERREGEWASVGTATKRLVGLLTRTMSV
jgi:hypothetical protein